MEEQEKYLIVGLGNPGTAYEKTRHNVGFEIVQSFAMSHKWSFRHVSHLIGDIAQGSVENKKILLLLPTTFMNSSGDAVRRCIDYFKVPIDHLLIVCDDVALPVGTIRMRVKGTSGGHNGLKSIETHLHTEYYARMRIGVGAPEHEELADYVLGKFSLEESQMIQEITQRATDALQLWISIGIAAAMQAANQVKKEEGEKNG